MGWGAGEGDVEVGEVAREADEGYAAEDYGDGAVFEGVGR